MDSTKPEAHSLKLTPEQKQAITSLLCSDSDDAHEQVWWFIDTIASAAADANADDLKHGLRRVIRECL